MNERKPVSVFKSICWGILLFVITYILIVIVGILYGFILGWLSKNINMISRIMNNKIAYFLILTGLTAGAGRIVCVILTAIFSKGIDASRNIQKGFLGAGIILILFGIVAIIISIISRNLRFLDLGFMVCGLFYCLVGNLSDDTKENTIPEISKSEPVNKLDKYDDFTQERLRMMINMWNEVEEKYSKGEISESEYNGQKDYISRYTKLIIENAEQ